MSSRSTYRRFKLGVLCVLSVVTVALAYVFAQRYHFNFWDDSYISLQYTKHLARGEGLVFNPGERVEGYTNFLWVILLAPLHVAADQLGGDFVAMVRACGVALTVINLWLTFLLAEHLFGPDRLASLVPPLLLAADDATPFFAIIGMENPLQQLWLLVALYAFVRRSERSHLWLGAALALAVLTRLDSAIFAGCFALAQVLAMVRKRRERSTRTAFRRFAVTWTIVGVVVLALFVWRRAYYGFWWPNTFYVKVSGDWSNLAWGWGYTRYFLFERVYVPLAMLLAVRWWRTPWVGVSMAAVIAHVAYIVYVGGDFYPGSRFLVVTLPFVYLLIGFALLRVLDGLPSVVPERLMGWVEDVGAVLVLAVAAVLAHLGFKRGPYATEIVRSADVNRDNVEYAKFIGTLRQPGDTIFAGRIGAIGYFGDVSVIDVYGLVDLAIAHEWVDIRRKDMVGHQKEATPEYGLAKQPTFIPFNLYSRDYRRHGYYMVPRLPDGEGQPYVWKRDELRRAAVLPGTFIDFGRPELSHWEQQGRAFRHNPVVGTVVRGRHVFGHRGAHVDSFHPDECDGLTGTLTSPSFELQGDRMLLDVGGGNQEAGQRVTLEVDGQVVAEASGNNSEFLCRTVWDVQPWRGRSARLRIIDAGRESWGHILVDSIRQVHLR